MITGKLYDWLKWIAQIFLPALGAMYFALSQIWGLPSGEEVLGTIVVFDTFLGALLGISQVNYAKQVADGDIHVEQTFDGLKYTLHLDDDPEELVNKREARFQVKKRKGVS